MTKQEARNKKLNKLNMLVKSAEEINGGFDSEQARIISDIAKPDKKVKPAPEHESMTLRLTEKDLLNFWRFYFVHCAVNNGGKNERFISAGINKFIVQAGRKVLEAKELKSAVLSESIFKKDFNEVSGFKKYFDLIGAVEPLVKQRQLGPLGITQFMKWNIVKDDKREVVEILDRVCNKMIEKGIAFGARTGRGAAVRYMLSTVAEELSQDMSPKYNEAFTQILDVQKNKENEALAKLKGQQASGS